MAGSLQSNLSTKHAGLSKKYVVIPKQKFTNRTHPRSAPLAHSTVYPRYCSQHVCREQLQLQRSLVHSSNAESMVKGRVWQRNFRVVCMAPLAGPLVCMLITCGCCCSLFSLRCLPAPEHARAVHALALTIIAGVQTAEHDRS